MKQLWMNSKRVLAVLLAVMMLVALLPVVAVTAATTGSVTVTAANYASGLTMTVDDASQLVYTQTDDSNNSHYYRMPAIVDGRAGHIAVELSGSNLTTWGAFDTAYGLPMAAEYIAVGAGTVVAEIRQKNGWGEPISGGAEITIENGFYLRKIDGAWTFCQPEAGTVDVFPRSAATSTLMWYMAPLPADYAGYYRFDNAGVQVNGAVTGNTIWFESAVAADASNYGSVCWVGGSYSSVTVAGGTNVIPWDPNTGLDLTNSSFTINQDFAATVDGTWTVTATEPAPPAPIDTNVTLAFDSAPAAGQFYFTYEADTRVTEKYYSMSVLADGTATTAVLELGANWDMTHAFIWSLPAATESLRIPAGTTLTESTADGAAIAGGQTLTIAEELRIVCTDGTWGNYVKPAPTDLSISFNNVDASNNWLFTYETNASLPPAGQWYVTTATVDGEERLVLMEYYPAASLFYIYSNCFAATPGTAAAPSSSLKIAAGAVLVPISTPEASATIDGVEFALTDAIDVAYEDGVWIDKKLVAEEVTLAVDTTKGTGGCMGEWTYAYGGTTYNVVSVALSNSPYVDAWLHAEGAVATLYGDVEVLLAMPDNGECWICFADTPPTEFTVYSYENYTSTDGKYAYRFVEQLTVDTETDSAHYGDPITYEEIDIDFSEVTLEGTTDLWVFAHNGTLTDGTYYKLETIIDYVYAEIIVEVRGATLVAYPGFFTALGGSIPVELLEIGNAALLTQIDPNNNWAAVDGGNVFQTAESSSAELRDGVWVNPDAPVVELTYIDIDSSVMADTIKGVEYNEGNTRSWIWVRNDTALPGADWTVYGGTVTVQVDGVDVAGCQAQKLDDADGKGFQIMLTGANYTSATTIVIPDGSKYQVDDTTYIRFVGDFVLNNEDGTWVKDGSDEPAHTDIYAEDVSVFAVVDQGGRTTFGLEIRGASIAYDAAWGNFTGDTTVLIDGVATAVTFGTTDADATWGMDSFENKFLIYAGGDVYDQNSSLVIPAGTLIVHPQTEEIYQFNNDIVIEKENGVWPVKTLLGAQVALGDTLKSIVTVRVPAAVYTEGMKLQYTVNGTTATATLTETGMQQLYIVNLSTAAKNVTDTYALQLVDADGNAVGLPFDYSVADYAAAIVRSYENGEAVYTEAAAKAAASLLTYARYAQEYFGYKTDDLASDIDMSDADITDADQRLAAVADMTASATDASFVGCSLLLRDTTAIRLYFSEQYAGTQAASNGLYYVDITGIGATELATARTAEVNGVTYSVSVLSLCKKVVANASTSNAFKMVARALCGYYTAAAELANA